MFVVSGLLMALTDKWTVDAVKPKADAAMRNGQDAGPAA
jgi:hypothetical protein